MVSEDYELYWKSKIYRAIRSSAILTTLSDTQPFSLTNCALNQKIKEKDPRQCGLLCPDDIGLAEANGFNYISISLLKEHNSHRRHYKAL